MDIDELIQRLQSLAAPDRDVDLEISRVTGFVMEYKANAGNQIVNLTRAPMFTRLVEDALKLVEHVAPGSAGGFSWEDGIGSARINDGPYAQASSPSIAICVAALRHKAYYG